MRSQEGIPVAADNLVECTELIARGRALVAGPLAGYETPPGAGVPGAILDQLLQEEGVDRAMFRLRAAPEVASKGAWRPILVPLPPLFVAPDGPDGVPFGSRSPRGPMRP